MKQQSSLLRILYFYFFLLLKIGCQAISKQSYDLSFDNHTPKSWNVIYKTNATLNIAWLRENITRGVIAAADYHSHFHVETEPRTDGLSHLYNLVLHTVPATPTHLEEALVFPVFSQKSKDCSPITEKLLHATHYNSSVITKVYQCGTTISLVPSIRSKTDQIIDINERMLEKDVSITGTEPIWLTGKNGPCAHRKESCRIEWHRVGTHDNRENENGGKFVYEVTVGLTEGRSTAKSVEEKNSSHSSHKFGITTEGSVGINSGFLTASWKVALDYGYEMGSGTEKMESQTETMFRDITRTQTQKFEYVVGGGQRLIVEQAVLVCDCFGYETAYVRSRNATPASPSNSSGYYLIAILLVIALLILLFAFFFWKFFCCCKGYETVSENLNEN